MKRLVYVLLPVMAFGVTAFGQETVERPRDFLDIVLSGDFLAKLIPLIIGFQVILYGIAEGLTRISVVTENKWDNKLAHGLSEVSWLIGVVIGKFGYSVPKLVVQEKDKKTSQNTEAEG